jgi:hypothetical protein
VYSADQRLGNGSTGCKGTVASATRMMKRGSELW